MSKTYPLSCLAPIEASDIDFLLKYIAHSLYSSLNTYVVPTTLLQHLGPRKSKSTLSHLELEFTLYNRLDIR